MALVVITINDDAHGSSSFAVLSEPPMPRSVLDGPPTKAQAAAAIMLNAIADKLQEEAPRVLTLVKP